MSMELFTGIFTLLFALLPPGVALQLVIAILVASGGIK